ncbi:two-component system sensor kinase [[Actinomadura] parvosata subsp. kistnae]|uniref:Oxygen sensor histidine kinase NreB n=1 Tax=[Actinomadura] parvosata subsp. kistnae TaxID=1909395 RepID=A0A1U9ZQT2_9ACTN|nr:sensor histidine kinase [Nonomuraea sp. ATCC 55076]AQZ60299.1 two-component sensor histidine kinase [Nonomuraea sp. ATCC 55076]SPL91204.1 two-component system sensor kinase [Actinomadura parvosata subsp. kistnae]
MDEAGWHRVFHLLFYTCLAMAATIATLEDGPDPVGLGLSALLGVWYTVFIARRPALLERLNPMAWHFLVLVVLNYALVRTNPSYQAMSYGLIAMPYLLLPGRWGYAGAAVFVLSSAAAAGAIEAIPGDPSVLAYVLGSTALTLIMGLFTRELVKHSEQSRVVGALEERARLAREIHDTLAQGFSGIIAQLEAAEQGGDDPEAVRKRIALAKRLARDSLKEARRSVDALRPEPLERAPLHEALSGVAERWSAATGVPAAVSVDGEPRRLPEDVEATLLRAAQEGLANVAKHARARRAVLTLSYMEEEVTLDVLDDGAGFDPDSAPAGGYGLIAMRERAARSGGTVTVESALGEGTALCVSIPCA